LELGPPDGTSPQTRTGRPEAARCTVNRRPPYRGRQHVQLIQIITNQGTTAAAPHTAHEWVTRPLG